MIMNEYQEIEYILKENRDQLQTTRLETRLKDINSLKDRLIQLINMNKIDETQKAVEERMGPQMCDNSQQQRREMKNSFQRVLKDYEQQIIAKVKFQKQQFCILKQKMKEKISDLQSKSKLFQSEQRGIIENQRIKISQMNEQQKEYLRDLKQPQRLHEMEAELYKFQNQMEMELLDIQIKQRKGMSQVLHEVQRLHKRFCK